jgi:hypothetical protein
VTTSPAIDTGNEPVIDLRNPALAALLAWLIPGAGHLYQRRTGKGILYMVCILGTFFYGMYLGDCKVVYASWRNNDTRWAYFCQIGVGLPALPALVQAERARSGRSPLFNVGFESPPKSADKWREEGVEQRQLAAQKQREADQALPDGADHSTDAEKKPGLADDLQKYDSPDELAWWNKYLYRYFELGTVYTMIAGLLNILAIYDAFAGPVPLELSSDDEEEKNSSRQASQPA